FFGWWLLATLAEADRRLALGVRTVAVTRDPDRCRARTPEVTTWPVELVGADVRRPLPVTGMFDAVVCGAASSSAATGAATPDETAETIVAGAAHTLGAAAPSGAVPGPATAPVAEDHPRDVPASPYAQAKRAAEVLCTGGAGAVVARCFAF